MSRPRIAVVSPFIDKRHGTERSVAECIERLASDFEIHLYSQRVEDLDLARIVWHRVPSLPGPHLFGYMWWFFANRMWRWRDLRFRRLRPDLVFSPGINCLDAGAIHVHVVFSQLRRQTTEQLRFGANPLRTWPQILHRRIYYGLIAALERRVYPRAEVPLAAVSRKTAADLLHDYGRSTRVHIAYSGIDLDRFRSARRMQLRGEARAQLGLGIEDCALLLIGNDWKSKGLDCVLDAAAHLAAPVVHILVVGDGNPAIFRARVRQSSLDARVHFLPPRSDVEFYYAAADVYVSPSLEDSFGLPVAEAMACGLPAITSRCAGVSEIMHPGEDGFVLDDPHDSLALSEVLRLLGADANLRERIGERAARTAESLTWESTAEQIRACWNEALCLSRAASSSK